MEEKKLLPSCAIKGKSTYTIPPPDVAGLHPYTLFVFAIGAPNGSVWPPTIFRVRVRVRVKTSCIINFCFTRTVVYELLVERVQREVLGPCMHALTLFHGHLTISIGPSAPLNPENEHKNLSTPFKHQGAWNVDFSTQHWKRCPLTRGAQFKNKRRCVAF